MWSVLPYLPPPNRVKVFAWAMLPVLYFVLPAEGVAFGQYPVTRLVAAVSMHLPFLLVISLVNLLRHRGKRDMVVMVSFIAFSVLITLTVVAALISTDDNLTAKYILSMQAAVFLTFHVWTYWYPEFLRDYYAWPWSRLPRGIRAAGVIRGLGHLIVLLINQVMVEMLPDVLWVIGAALVPVLVLTITDAATVGYLFAKGLRPRGYGEDE